MNSRKRIETVTETQEVWVIRRERKGALAWCSDCVAQAVILTPEEAAQLMGLSARDIYRSIEAGEIHFMERANHELLVCLASLARPGQNRLR